MRLTTSKRGFFKNHLLSNLAAAPPPEIILGFVGVSTHLGNHPEQRLELLAAGPGKPIGQG
jgi:hypothetical protein